MPLSFADFFYDPLTDDVEELLAHFQQMDSVRYGDFSAVWRQMVFSDVFRGISSVSEMKRFSRVAMATAVKYFLPPYSYQIRVGGLYLLFAFYHTQLAIPPVQIRLSLKDYETVQKFVMDSIDSGHHDVVYIYRKLVATKALHYTAMPHLLFFQKQRKPKHEPVCTGMLARVTAVKELISADFLEELTNIQSHYDKLKRDTAGVSSQANMVHKDFTSNLNQCLTEFDTWQQKTFSKERKDNNSGNEEDEEEEEEEEKPDETCSSRAQLLSSIKQKSYSSTLEVSKSRRHRQVELVDSCSSGAELVQETSSRRRKRPVSLKARTWKKLTVKQEVNILQDWLLSAPEHDNVPMKRSQARRQAMLEKAEQKPSDVTR